VRGTRGKSWKNQKSGGTPFPGGKKKTLLGRRYTEFDDRAAKKTIASSGPENPALQKGTSGKRRWLQKKAVTCGKKSVANPKRAPETRKNDGSRASLGVPGQKTRKKGGHELSAKSRAEGPTGKVNGKRAYQSKSGGSLFKRGRGIANP